MVEPHLEKISSGLLKASWTALRKFDKKGVLSYVFRKTFVPVSSVVGFSFSRAGTKLELYETSFETRKF